MDKGEVYRLNPQYHLRNDVRRILLYSKAHTDERSSRNWYAFIHPLQALMLSFFTYERTLEENIRLLSEYFHCELSAIERYVAPFIENKDLLCTYWHGQEIVFPKNVLVPAVLHDCYPELSPQNFICHDLDLVRRRLYSAPLSVTFMLTNKCVTHCCYCYADTKTQVVKRLSTERICKLIEEAGRLRMKHVNLIGGEIFLHPDWVRILRKTVDCGVEPEYISTKMPFTPDRIEALLSTGYKGVIQVSLDALDAHVLRPLLNVSEDYPDKIKEGIRLLDNSGLNYQVSTVLTTYNANVDVLTEVYRFLSGLKNVTAWNIVPVHDSLYPNVEDFRVLKPSLDKLEEVFGLLEERVARGPFLSVVIDRDTPNRQYYADKGGSRCFRGNKCSALNTHMFILPDGKVTICEQLYWHPYFIIGDVTKSNLTSVWNSRRATYLYHKSWQDIHPSSRCASCALSKECFQSNNRCWADIMKAYGKDCYDYPDPRCDLAVPMKNYIGY